MPELFDAQFVNAIRQLRIAAKQVPRGGRHAEQSSVQLGAGQEFRDFRPYVAGDDIRRIDWNLYRRTGELFVRLFEETRDLPVYILLDVSDSMFFETPPRADAGRKAAAAVAAAALNQHDAVWLHAVGSELGRPVPISLGRGGLVRALEHLESLTPAGPTGLVAALRRLAMQRLRSGLVVIVSDLFDPRGIDSLCEAMRSLRHRLALVQLVRATDAEPDLTGQVRLEDCETGRDVTVTATPAVLDHYREAYRQFENRLAEFVAHRRAARLLLDADQPVLDQLRHLFIGGVMSVRG